VLNSTYSQRTGLNCIQLRYVGALISSPACWPYSMQLIYCLVMYRLLQAQWQRYSRALECPSPRVLIHASFYDRSFEYFALITVLIIFTENHYQWRLHRMSVSPCNDVIAWTYWHSVKTNDFHFYRIIADAIKMTGSLIKSDHLHDVHFNSSYGLKSHNERTCMAIKNIFKA